MGPRRASSKPEVLSQRAVPTLSLPRLRGRMSMILGVGLISVIVLSAILAPLLTPFSPNTQDISAALLPPGAQGHIVGTDQFGRDVLTRILYAGRIDLIIAFAATLVAMVVGSLIGLVAGFMGRRVETVLLRIVDVFFAFPFIVLVLVVIAVLGTGLINMLIAMWLVTWAPYARIVHGEVLVARSQEYVLGAQALGFGRLRIMTRHILPNVIGPAIVYGTVDAVNNVSLGAALGYLGLGVQTPTAEWGNMISDSQIFIATNWWLSVGPGVAIAIFGVAVSLIGDGLTNRLRGEF